MKYSKSQAGVLILLRIAIGWHFLYEGLSKIFQPDWSSMAYLMDSKGCLAGIFNWIASHQTVLQVADVMNEWGLTLIGLSLILGIFTRISSISGIILLLFYYLSHPAWIGFDYLFPAEGTYFIVSKNIIEALALLVLYFFPTDHIVGLGRLVCRRDG